MLAAALIAAAALAAAPAAPRSIMQDDTLVLRSGPAARDAALDEMRALGVDTVRVLALWRDHASAPLALRRPAEPYPPTAFAALDGLMTAARARGLDVLLTPTGPGPAWASTCGGRPRARQACAPRASAFGRFVRTLGRRYAHQRLWAVWNEPNVATWLAPQFDARGAPASPARYRALLRAAARALARTGHGADELLIGEVASIGQSRRSPRTRVTAAEPFVRRLLCRRCGRLPGTGFAHHPYTPAAALPVCSPGARGQLPPSRLGRLRAILDAAARRGVVRRLGLWLTEAGFQTNPPDRLAGIRPRAQAARINQLEHLTAPSVHATAQYLLVDDRRSSGFQSGLRYASGLPKPALAAYRLPLWIDRRGRLWGRVRPADGRERLALQRRGARGWRTARALRTGHDGVVRARVGRGTWRLRWRGHASRAARPARSCR
jgi:hypothetical protein